MSESEGMVSKHLDKVNKFYKIGAKHIKVQMNLLGTKFAVSRPKDNSKWKNVFGGIYSSDSTNETDYEHFTTKLIVNLNEMKDVWSRNRDMIDAYSSEGDLEVGDELQYTRDKITYRFKLVQKMAYSEASSDSGIYYYTLSSIIETKDM